MFESLEAIRGIRAHVPSIMHEMCRCCFEAVRPMFAYLRRLSSAPRLQQAEPCAKAAFGSFSALEVRLKVAL